MPKRPPLQIYLHSSLAYNNATTANPAPTRAPCRLTPAVGSTPAALVAAETTLDPPEVTVDATPVATLAAPDVTVLKTPPAPDVMVEATPVATDAAPDVTCSSISLLYTER